MQKGINEATGAYLAGLFAFFSIFTTLGMGWVGDRWSKPLLSSLGIIPILIAILAIILSDLKPVIYLFPFGLAVLFGSIPLNWALIGDFFGRRIYATLRGVMGAFYSMITFLSPIYAGWTYDRTGSYTLVLATLAVILIVSASLFALLRRPVHTLQTNKSVSQ